MTALTPEQRAQIRALLDADEQGVPVTEWDEFRIDISGERWTPLSRIVTYADMIARSVAPAPHYRKYQRRSTLGMREGE